MIKLKFKSYTHFKLFIGEVKAEAIEEYVRIKAAKSVEAVKNKKADK